MSPVTKLASPDAVAPVAAQDPVVTMPVFVPETATGFCRIRCQQLARSTRATLDAIAVCGSTPSRMPTPKTWQTRTEIDRPLNGVFMFVTLFLPVEPSWLHYLVG